MEIKKSVYPFKCQFCGIEVKFSPEDFKTGRIQKTRYWLTSDGFDVSCPVCGKTNCKVDLKAEVESK